MIVRSTRVVSIIGVGVLALAWSAHAVSGQADPTSPRPLASVAGKPAASFAGLDATRLHRDPSSSCRAIRVCRGYRRRQRQRVRVALRARWRVRGSDGARDERPRGAGRARASQHARSQSAFHFIVNHVIEPTSEGAVGKEYLLQLRIGEGERPNDIFGGGHYEDIYVRTPDGWRFKRRQFTPSEGGPAPRREAGSQTGTRPARRTDMTMRNVVTTAALGVILLGFSGTSAQQATSPTPVLTALDYLEIEQFVYRYGYALDTGADNGFGTPDLYAARCDVHGHQSRSERQNLSGARAARRARARRKARPELHEPLCHQRRDRARPGRRDRKDLRWHLRHRQWRQRGQEPGRSRRALQRRVREDAARLALQVARASSNRRLVRQCSRRRRCWRRRAR